MALDRWIALIILMICMAYGYAAFFTIDAGLPPFMQRNAIWPSTFPKVLTVLAIISALIIVLGKSKGSDELKDGDINYSRLTDYNLGQALSLLAMMAIYALMLRPAGFVISTVAFLTICAMVLGERKLQYLLPITLLATGIVWYLVQVVLGIYLRPLPYFLGTGG